MTFQELCLDPMIQSAIAAAGFQAPSEIQRRAIPEILKGSDLQASAQTGTGKTAAFLLPALQKILTPHPKEGKGPRVLILVPTRELALQVAQESIKYSRSLPKCKTICIYGGVSYAAQNKDLGKHYEILVATPGRLMDHMARGKIDLSRIELFILDEADRMLDMGFIQPVEEIASKLPKNRQTLLFSATLAGSILNLSRKLLKNPVEVAVSAATSFQQSNIAQTVHRTDSLEHKYDLLDQLLCDPAINQAIIFTSTQRQAATLADKLADSGRDTRALHGGMNQRQRSRTIKEMREQKFDILVATDVAARGIDIRTITHVINFDLPRNAEDYVHRIGRTGRASSTGIALSMVSKREIPLVRAIEKFTGKKMDFAPLPAGQEEKIATEAPRRRERDDAPRGRYNPRFGAGKPKQKKHPFSFPKKKKW